MLLRKGTRVTCRYGPGTITAVNQNNPIRTYQIIWAWTEGTHWWHKEAIGYTVQVLQAPPPQGAWAR